MAMLISKFHRLIQSKVLWITICVLIVISFVFLGLPRGNPDVRQERALAELYGKKVMNSEYAPYYFYTKANLVRQVLANKKKMPRMSDVLMEMLEHNAWLRLVTLKEAAELGIRVPLDEVLDFNREYPPFIHQGQFNFLLYTNMIRQVFNMNESDFLESVKQDLIIYKLQRLVSQTVLVSPLELVDRFRMYTDQFEVDYVMITTNDIDQNIEVTEEDAQKYYEENRERFREPEKLKTKYIYLPYSNYLASVTITTNELMLYYSENLDEFKMTETNAVATKSTEAADAPLDDADADVAATNGAISADATSTQQTDTATLHMTNLPFVVDAAAETPPAEPATVAQSDMVLSNADMLVATSAASPLDLRGDLFDPAMLMATDSVPTGMETQYMPFDDVRSNIWVTLTQQKARQQALSAAGNFIDSVIPQRFAQAAPSFEYLAISNQYEVVSLQPFGSPYELEDIDSPWIYAQAAASLNTEFEMFGHISDPVAVDQGVYMIAMEERIPPTIPPFDEVKEKAIDLAKGDRIGTAMLQKANAVRDQALKLLSEGQAFTNICDKLNLDAQYTEPFTFLSVQRSYDQVMQLLFGMVYDRNEGELSDIETMPMEDSYIIAYLRTRAAGDMLTLDAMKYQMTSSIRNEYSSIIFRSYQEKLLEEAGFKSLAPKRKKTDDKAEEAEAVDEEMTQEERPSDQ